jgi:trimethylamine--corrinoid protein Co-methyltransferase
MKYEKQLPTFPPNEFNPYRSLTDDQLNTIQDASLEILSQTGVRFHHPEALDLFRSAGADISDGSLVHIPPSMVERALRSAPENITLFNQKGEPAMEVGERRKYFGPGSDCMYIYDQESNQRRKARLSDVVDGIRLADSLDHIDFIMSMFLPSDVPDAHYEQEQMLVMLTESTKPIIFVGIEGASTSRAIQMAATAVGGIKELQNHPFIINYVNTVSVFQHNQDSVERLLYAAERNIPTIYAPGKLRGMTAPMTKAGALALGSAGQLAGLVLSQLKKEGSPFIISNPGHGTLDMRTMLGLYNTPDDGPQGWDLVHHYHLPSFAIAGASDAKVFDSQAASEAALSLFAVTLGGANLIHDLGYLDCAMTGSLELLLLCNEIVSWLKHYFSDIEISKETLALDLIQDVGPDKYFLQTPHTLQHVREDWWPSLFDHYDYQSWNELGETTLKDRAQKKIQQILESRSPGKLAPEVKKQLKEIMSEA